MASPAKDRLAALGKLYASNRPLIQRTLNIGFALYVVHNTYRSISARPAASSPEQSKGKGKAKAKEDGEAPKRPPRVAVRSTLYDLSWKRLIKGQL